tara:strand:- start:500 stop:793 length:294 start_codon:yes stop_codon:yes gene_type:complete
MTNETKISWCKNTTLTKTIEMGHSKNSYVIFVENFKGFIEIERLSPPTAKSMGMHRASAWLGTDYEYGTFLSYYDFRSVSGKEKAMKKLREAIENGN